MIEIDATRTIAHVYTIQPSTLPPTTHSLTHSLTHPLRPKQRLPLPNPATRMLPLPPHLTTRLPLRRIATPRTRPQSCTHTEAMHGSWRGTRLRPRIRRVSDFLAAVCLVV